MKAVKWLAILLSSLIGLFVAAAIIVPLVVDVDKYRPQIVEAANQQLNGKLEIGKLSLSLWGQIRIQVDGVDLKDSAGHSVVSVKDAYFHLPFLSVLSGSPEMIFRMDRPSVSVIKYKDGKINALGLMKQASAPAAGNKQPVAGNQQPATPPAASGAAGAPVKLPAIAARARMGIEMLDALVSYADEATGLKSDIRDLNLVIKDISLSRTTDLELWANLDTTMGKTLTVRGPARITAHVKPELVGGAFDHVSVDAKVDLDGLDIASGDMFHKDKGMAANADFAATASANEAKIDHFNVKFFNAEIKSSGALIHLATTPVVNFTVASNDIDLKAWNQLVPMLKDFDLGGSAKLDASAQGPSDKLGYKAKFAIRDLTAKAPKLKAEPHFDLAVDVVTDEIQNVLFTMKAPGNELTFKGKLVNFARPQGVFEISSPGMDLDQLVEWPPASAKTEAKAEAAPAAGGAVTATGAKAPVADLDASVDPLRANPAAAQASVVAGINIKMLKAQGIRMDDMVGKLYFKNLVAGLDGFAMKLWNGKVKASFATQLKPKQPTYTFGMLLDGLDLQKAAEANVQAVKNTLIGKLHFDVNGSGSSFNPDPAKGNLKAKGSFKVENAVFETVDVTKMATDGINKALASVGDRVPQAKGKTVGSINGKQSKYDWVASSFSVEGGRFKMPDFATKAAANQGIDLKGNTEVGLKDYSLNTAWDVIDTYDLTGARKIAVDAAGTHVDHLLAEGNNPVKFTVHAGCTCLQPCYSYTEVPEQLIKVAMGNMTGAMSGKAKAELQNRIQSVIPKSAPPAVSNALNKLFH